MRFEPLIAVKIEFLAFLIMAPCGRVGGLQLFGGICCLCLKEHLGSCCRAVDARRDCGFSSHASGYVVS